MDLVARFYPEAAAGGFTRVDGSVEFYTRVRALVGPDSQVLDFGAGRGWAVTDDPVAARRRLAGLRGSVARVVGVDVDAAVLDNPGVDEAIVVRPGDRLPFPDASFDLVLCDSVLEHLRRPEHAAAEIDRVLRPGGWICARTPNRYGYIALGARLVPNRLHRLALRRLQPDRKRADVFPTAYRMNTRRALARWFAPARFRHVVYPWDAEPAYAGRSQLLWLLLWGWARVAPPPLHAVWFVFLQKRGDVP